MLISLSEMDIVLNLLVYFNAEQPTFTPGVKCTQYAHPPELAGNAKLVHGQSCPHSKF